MSKVHLNRLQKMLGMGSSRSLQIQCAILKVEYRKSKKMPDYKYPLNENYTDQQLSEFFLAVRNLKVTEDIADISATVWIKSGGWFILSFDYEEGDYLWTSHSSPTIPDALKYIEMTEELRVRILKILTVAYTDLVRKIAHTLANNEDDLYSEEDVTDLTKDFYIEFILNQDLPHNVLELIHKEIINYETSKNVNLILECTGDRNV